MLEQEKNDGSYYKKKNKTMNNIIMIERKTMYLEKKNVYVETSYSNVKF
jgi:hypothetical protein